MSSSQLPAVAQIPTPDEGERLVLSIPQRFSVSENFANLSASARTSRTRVDLLPNTPTREILTAEPSIQDEEGGPTSAQEPPREEARAEPMVSLTILVLSGDRKKFTFHPDTTAGRVKEMIWSTWDAGTPSSPRCTLGISESYYGSKIGRRLPYPLIHRISDSCIWGGYCKTMTLYRVSGGGCRFGSLG